MSKIKLDLSQFKHKESDKHSTTLEHKKDKHMITLYHKALSPENQEQLKALGSSAKDAKQSDDKGEAKADSQAQDAKYGKIMDPKGNKPQVYAEGGEVETEEPMQQPEAVPEQTPVEQATQFDVNKVPDVEGTPQDQYQKRFAEYKATYPNQPDEVIDRSVLRDMGQHREEQQKVSEEKVKADKDAQYEKEFQAETAGKAYAEKLAKAGLAPQAAQPQAVQQGPVAPQAGVQPQQPQAPAAQPQQGMQDMESMLQGGYQKQMAGINAQAAAQGELGKQQAELLNQQVNNQKAAIDTYNKQYQDLDNERKAHIADIQAGRIDPEKYWTGDAEGNGSHSKLAAGIGMILAGFNPTNQPNAAINYLKYQMDKNLEAQQKNLDSQQNLLSANLRQFGNLKDAKEMTRLMQADILTNELQKAAATAQSPMAKAAALQAAGKLQMEFAPMQQQFAMRRAMMNLANDPSGPKDGAIQQMISYKRAMGDHAGAKELEDHYVPGIGYSPTQAIPPAVREKLTIHKQMDTAARDLADWTKNHTTLVPGTPDYNVGQQKALALQSAVREAQLGGVYKEAEQHLLNTFVNTNPAGILKMTKTMPQLGELIQHNEKNFNVLKQSVGLPVQQAPTKIAVNPKTGEKLGLINGKWSPIK